MSERKTLPFPLLVLLGLVLLAGCASPNGGSRQQTEQSIRDELAAGSQASVAQPAPPPSDILDELAPPAPPMPEPAAAEPRFDISVANAPADVFFMSLVADTGVNMVVHPAVSGSISLDLKQVTIEDVLKLTREVYGYEFRRSGSGYIVLPARIQSRIFSVNYLNVNRSGQSSMSVSSGQLADAGGEDENGDTQRNSQGSNAESSRIQTRSQADFWSGLKATLQSIIGGGDGRSVVVDRHAGLVVVRAMPGELRDVEAYLQRAQASMQRQVILEAKIIEVRLNDGFQSGIDWAALSRSGGDELFLGQAGIVDGNASLYDADGNLSRAAMLTGQAAGFGNLFAIGGATGDFGALIRLLSTQGDVQVLSSPRISTLNNQKAVIKVGSDEFFVTDISSTTSSNASSTVTSPDITLTPFFSGIALDVTPQISENGEVILHIHPSVSEVVDQTKNITVSGQSQQLPLALSTVRESDSVVRARSGQVVVIGGLMQNRSSNDDAAVPGVGDVPLFGELLKQKRDNNSRSELVILLKPLVVDNDRTWNDYISATRDRIEQLQRARRDGPE
jgi:MSHA biogenesis protein MshL